MKLAPAAALSLAALSACNLILGNEGTGTVVLLEDGGSGSSGGSGNATSSGGSTSSSGGGGLSSASGGPPTDDAGPSSSSGGPSACACGPTDAGACSACVPTTYSALALTGLSELAATDDCLLVRLSTQVYKVPLHDASPYDTLSDPHERIATATPGSPVQSFFALDEAPSNKRMLRRCDAVASNGPVLNDGGTYGAATQLLSVKDGVLVVEANASFVSAGFADPVVLGPVKAGARVAANDDTVFISKDNSVTPHAYGPAPASALITLTSAPAFLAANARELVAGPCGNSVQVCAVSLDGGSQRALGMDTPVDAITAAYVDGPLLLVSTAEAAYWCDLGSCSSLVSLTSKPILSVTRNSTTMFILTGDSAIWRAERSKLVP